MRPSAISERDYLSDTGLANVEALVPKMAHDFEADVNATAKTATVVLRWDQPADVIERANSVDPLLHGAMCVDTLCKNLRAARAENERLRALLHEVHGVETWDEVRALCRRIEALDSPESGTSGEGGGDGPFVQGR